VRTARVAKISGATLAERAAVAKVAKEREPWSLGVGEVDRLQA
jgi:hypothetical protein